MRCGRLKTDLRSAFAREQRFRRVTRTALWRQPEEPVPLAEWIATGTSRVAIRQ